MKKFITDNKYLSCAGVALVNSAIIGCILWRMMKYSDVSSYSKCPLSPFLIDILGCSACSIMSIMLTTIQIIFDRYVHPKFSDEPFVQYSLTAAESVLQVLACKQDTKEMTAEECIALILINTFGALTCKYILELDSTDMESETVMYEDTEEGAFEVNLIY